MTRRMFRLRDYVVGLADGHVRAPLSRAVSRRARTAPSIEQAMAECFHQQVSGLAAPLEQYRTWRARGILPSHVHVWLVGSDGWLAAGPTPRYSPPLWQLLAGDDETDRGYRVLLWGVDVSETSGYFRSEWNAWLGGASLRQKRRTDRRPFDETANSILQALARRYLATLRPPTGAILSPDFKLAYAGG
jgi:hypothetical protein